MKKILHIAKANALRHKGATLSLFIIIAIVSALSCVALSILTQIERNFWDGIDRMNSMHNVFIMPRDKYQPSFDNILENDPRVSYYERTEVLFASSPTLYYGGNTETGVIIANMDTPITIDAPVVTEHDLTVPPESAIFLPGLAKNISFKTGDPFTITYKNRELDFTVAGFFETATLSNAQHFAIRFFVPDEGYQRLTRYISRSAYLAVRLHNSDDSAAFRSDFSDKTDLVTAVRSDILFYTAQDGAVAALSPTYAMSAVILLFSIILIAVSIFVIRFRVTNSIENTMHEIGVLKAQGYTSRQIAACYAAEYMAISVPASILGVIVSLPVFALIRGAFSWMSGFPWTFGASGAAGAIAVLMISASLLLMVWLSSRRIKKLPPVTALRGGIAISNFRRNYFPLSRFAGNVHLGLGLKNMFAYFKLYTMIAFIIAGISLAIVFMAVTYQNFGIDYTAMIKSMGVEPADVMVTVTQRADAAALSAEIEQMPDVRKTIMMDWVGLKIDGHDAFGYMSDDYGRYETFLPSEGRMPLYDNEVAVTGRFAHQSGKVVGDGVRVTVNGVSQEYIITGHFSSTLDTGGRSAAITLEGYQRLDPNYMRRSIGIYLNDGVTYSEFSEKVKQRFGVLNVFHDEEGGRFSAARARAEEKISAYLEYYNIDSVEYAVIYNGDIILSRSSDAYQIEKLEDFFEFVEANVGVFGDVIGTITLVVIVVSLIISSLILSMTIRSIIVKRRRELGILKSGGFTTKQLARQMAISFMPMAAIGVALGCTGGALAVNPAMGMALYTAGMDNVNFEVSPPIVLLLGAAILLATYIAANISAMRIKHISVYELMSE